MNPNESMCVICACDFKVDPGATGNAMIMCIKCRKKLKLAGASAVKEIEGNTATYNRKLEDADNSNRFTDAELLERKIKWLSFTIDIFKEREKLSPRYKPHPETGKPVISGYRCPCGSFNIKKCCITCESKFQIKLQAYAKTLRQ